jgi:hypothetical protein
MALRKPSKSGASIRTPSLSRAGSGSGALLALQCLRLP